MGIQLKGINFPYFVFGQSGVQGFFGESDEYRHHKWYRRLVPGFTFENMVFVAKTGTVELRVYPESSNTELRDGYKVKDFFPTSIWCTFWSFFYGYLLNAIGLANPGFAVMLEYGKWQKRSEPFFLSFMPVETTHEGKLAETRTFCELLKKHMRFVSAHLNYGIQVNLSCSNTGHDNVQDVEELKDILRIFKIELPNVPIVPKFDLLIYPESISALKDLCDAFCIANSVPFGKLEDSINWHDLFNTFSRSPLERRFKSKPKGGLSGKPLFPVLIQWLVKMEHIDPTVKIIAGGGIMLKRDIKKLSHFHIVKGVALGSVAILRPWRMNGLIQYGNKIFSFKKP